MSDDGNGGSPDIDFYRAGKLRNQYEELLKQTVKKYYSKNPMRGEFSNLKPDAELLMYELLALGDREKKYKQLQKKGYKLVICYSQNEYEENLVGVKSLEYANAYIAKNEITNAKIYTRLGDFIIE